MTQRRTSRRRFLAAGAAAGLATPYFFTAARLAAQQPAAKSERPLLGAIGCGGQGSGIANRAKGFGEMAAVCDVDEERAAKAQQGLGGGKADAYTDYRRLLDRKDIDVVTIGTPDHWHTKIAIEAMQSGKDVYCEKPLTLTIDEGKQILKVLGETGRVFQVGTQQRSHGPFAQAVAMVRDGRVGKVQRITVAIGGGPRGGPFKKEEPPKNLNWDMWLGQAPLVDYIKERCHYQFRWWLEYSGGKMTDWGAHHVDVAHWMLAADDTGPVHYEGTAVWPVPFKDGHPTADDQYNSALKFNVKCRFADGVEMLITDRTDEFDNGVLVEGDQGRLFVNRGRLTGKPVEDLKDKPLPEDALTKVYKGKRHGDHMRNFFECIQTREQPISDVASHHRAMTTCHLANLCLRLDRPLEWDPKTEQILNDEEARRWQSREQRKGYEIVV